MALRANLVRPDDLLDLQIEGVNLRLDLDDPGAPAVVVDDPDTDACLVVVFPPQAIVEEATFESSSLEQPSGDKQQPKATNTGLVVGQTARSRIAGTTRLVFRVPADRRIPYTIEGLLDWNDLDLQVSPIAEAGEAPTPNELKSVPAISPPGPLVTAIELPYRLVLSPTSSVGWDHLTTGSTAAGRSELWHTRLAHRDDTGTLSPISKAAPALLRAIWSPDFNPDRFHGSDPPRFMQPDGDWGAPPGVLTAMTPSDRHEIVVLTSGFHGFVKGLSDDRSPIDTTTFLPTPIRAEELMLSALGGWLKSRGHWRPPMPWRSRELVTADAISDRLDHLITSLRAAPPDRDPVVPVPNQPVPQFTAAPALRSDTERTGTSISRESAWLTRASRLGEPGHSLNVSEWVHGATQGRDHFVRIVYEGFVYWPRHRAALIKVTERKIRESADGRPVAYLVQKMFVVIREPLMDYSAEVQRDASYGRRMPLRRIRLTTLTTPDIDKPTNIRTPPDIDKPTNIGSPACFWIEVGGRPFRFNAVGEDLTGNLVDFTTALIFVPNSEIGKSDAIMAVRAAHLAAEPERRCPVPGQKLAFADPTGDDASDNTTLVTSALHFTTDSPDQTGGSGSGGGPAFRPTLWKAAVRLPAVEQLLGTDAPAEIAYEPGYLADGFGGDNQTGLFARMVAEAKPGFITAHKVSAPFAADQAGGVATPDLSISGLTRQLGPVAGDDLTAVARNDFDPGDFFKDVGATAKLFGTIPLIDLLIGGTMDGGAPTVQMTSEPVSGAPNQRRLVAVLRWTPQVKSVLLGIVNLDVGPDTAFTIDGRVERIVEVPPGATPGTASSIFTGRLVNFDIDVLGVVAVHFVEFRFTSESGRKPAVNISLDAIPVTFEGELDFVNELQKYVPPGLFGDGASLDISPTRIRAGFGIALPPLSIGIFALENVALNAAVELPFLDGKPLFDFGVSTREHPFCLTVSLLGGGGFFHIQLDTSGILMLEAALEFGAAACINLGVASGSVHIMAGVYFAMGKKDGKDLSVLSGYLRLGGELSVLGLISISLEFVLSFGYENGKAAGRATLMVKVEVLFFSKSVEITVEKKFGGSSGDPRFVDVFDTPAVWDEYASAFG